MQITQPLQIVMSRDGSDADHEALREARGTILDEPRVGHAVQVYFDDGKWLRTSPVRAYARHGRELRVETVNSTYRLKIIDAAA